MSLRKQSNNTKKIKEKDAQYSFLSLYASNNSLALEAYEVESRESYSTLSVNLPGQSYLLEEDEFFFDTNSDYIWKMDALIENKIISMTDKIGQSGFRTYPVCKLLIDLPEDK